MSPEQIQAEARARAKKIARQAGRETNKAAVKKNRDKTNPNPRPKRPNGSIPEHIRNAERNGKVARHRARKAGKTEEQAEHAYQAAYKRSLARYAREKNLDAEEIEQEAKAHTEEVGAGRSGESEAKVYCGALRTEDGQKIYDEEGNTVTCKQVAGYGTDHLGYGRCKYHGGNTPNGIIAAEREEISTRMVKNELTFYGAAIDTDPVQALADEVRRSAGHVAWLGAEVRKLRDGELTTETGFGVAPNILIKMYQTEREYLVMASKAAISAGVAERTIQLAEQQGQILATVIRDILWDKDLELTPDQRQKSRDVVRRHLMAIDTQSTEEPLKTLEAG